MVERGPGCSAPCMSCPLPSFILLLQVLRQQAALHLTCILIDSIGERVMRYGAAILQTIVPVLEANKRRGAEAGDEDEDDEVDNDDEVEEEMGGEVEDKAGEKDIEVGETVEVGGASSDAAAAQTIDSWVHQGIFGEESHSGHSDNSNNNWQVLYFAVFAFEKLESHCPALLREAAACHLTRLMCGPTALLHSHPWVRKQPLIVKEDMPKCFGIVLSLYSLSAFKHACRSGLLLHGPLARVLQARCIAAHNPNCAQRNSETGAGRVRHNGFGGCRGGAEGYGQGKCVRAPGWLWP